MGFYLGFAKIMPILNQSFYKKALFKPISSLYQAYIMSTHLSRHFLVAMPNMDDERFAHSVALLCEHNEHGALGLIINQPMQLKLGDMMRSAGFAKSDLPPKIDQMPVYYGGPVLAERGFVLHDGDVNLWTASVKITDILTLTTSRDILDDIGQGKGPDHFLVILGHSAWHAGQLEAELKQNIWLTMPSSTRLIFDVPNDLRWQMAADGFGVDVRLLAATVGRA